MAFSPGLGMTVSRGGTAVGQVLNVTPHSPTVGQVETTHLGSTERAFLPTILDAGQITLTVEYDATLAGIAGVTTAMFAKTVEAWLITFADTGAATWSASGFVTNFAFQSATVDNVALADITVKLTGAIIITP